MKRYRSNRSLQVMFDQSSSLTLVRLVPGIGKKYGQVLADHGFIYARQLLGYYLILKDSDMFRKWLQYQFQIPKFRAAESKSPDVPEKCERKLWRLWVFSFSSHQCLEWIDSTNFMTTYRSWEMFVSCKRISGSRCNRYEYVSLSLVMLQITESEMRRCRRLWLISFSKNTFVFVRSIGSWSANRSFVLFVELILKTLPSKIIHHQCFLKNFTRQSQV